MSNAHSPPDAGVGDFPRDAQRLVDRELFLAIEPVAERFPLDQRHDIVEEAGSLP